MDYTDTSNTDTTLDMGRHGGHSVSDFDKPSVRPRSRSTCGALPWWASTAGDETDELFEVLASQKCALTQGDSGLPR